MLAQCQLDWSRALGQNQSQTGTQIPISWKSGLRDPKTPISLRLHTGWTIGFSVKISPFPLWSLERTRGNGDLSGTGDSQPDSRESFAIEIPIFIARQADSHESLEFPIRANHATKMGIFRVFLNLWFAKPMVWVRVVFHENDGNHENDENDEDNEDNSDRYKQGVECWIRGNHGNHENDESHENPGCKPRVPQTKNPLFGQKLSQKKLFNFLLFSLLSSCDLRHRNGIFAPFFLFIFHIFFFFLFSLSLHGFRNTRILGLTKPSFPGNRDSGPSLGSGGFQLEWPFPLHGRPIFIQCRCWEELCSPFAGAKPSTGKKDCTRGSNNIIQCPARPLCRNVSGIFVV